MFPVWVGNWQFGFGPSGVELPIAYPYGEHSVSKKKISIKKSPYGEYSFLISPLQGKLRHYSVQRAAHVERSLDRWWIGIPKNTFFACLEQILLIISKNICTRHTRNRFKSAKILNHE